MAAARSNKKAQALARKGKANIGFILSQEQFPITELMEYGPKAEKAGWDAVWTSDHFQPWQDNQGHANSAWVTLAALGQLVKEIPMGTGVTCPTYRYHPAIVAQSFASLGILYPGRVFLGVGTGEALNEQAATGDWGEYEERAERLVEAIEVIRKLWTGEHVEHKGKYYTVSAKLYDVPEVPVPIYVAASGPESMHLAGKYGDGLITDGKSAIDPELRKEFERGARDAGKDPAEMPIVAEVFVHAGSKEEASKYAELWRFLPKAWDKYVENPSPVEINKQADREVPIEDVLAKWKYGEDPQVHIDGLQELVDGGVSTVFVHSADPEQVKFIEWYAENVLPRVKR